MNAVDALFEFAALMATSSAMTLEPDTINAPNRSAQGSSASNDPAIPKIARPPSHNAPVQQALHPQSKKYTQPALPSPPAHQHERILEPWPMETYLPQQSGEYQQAWPSEPQQQQQQQKQQHFAQLPNFECTLPCGHHPYQQCQCAYIPETSAYAAAPWGMGCGSSQQAEAVRRQVRYVSDEDGYGCGEGCLRQQGRCENFLMRGYCTGGGGGGGGGGGLWDGNQGHGVHGEWMVEQGVQGCGGMEGCGLYY
ncbi:hypothetical protein ST47_g3007 [Ascochyta rabiei]|uniref:Uncharacterized protein n=1 Tax=Didymella rabiei TaxID=5454 RepID=A0A163ITR2_DIDRA|nr:hypothetical protein ST47_g3007 [Ascochyta rabiei]